MESVQIIQAGIEHVDKVAPLFDAYRQFYKQPGDLDAARRFVHDRLSRDESVVFFAQRDGEALGFTQLYPTFSSISLKRLWILNDLFVAPHARRSGVAQMLMARAQQLARETQAVGLMLETAVDNLPAQELYEQLGWQREVEFYTYGFNL